jgi:hypothetical protein
VQTKGAAMSQVQKKKAVNFGGSKSPLASPGAQSPGSPTGGLVSPLVRAVEVEEEPLPEQPALFLPTGSPTLLIEQSPYHEFLRDFGMKYNFPERLPKCIVCVSARWVSDTGMCIIPLVVRAKSCFSFGASPCWHILLPTMVVVHTNIPQYCTRMARPLIRGAEQKMERSKSRCCWWRWWS